MCLYMSWSPSRMLGSAGRDRFQRQYPQQAGSKPQGGARLLDTPKTNAHALIRFLMSCNQPKSPQAGRVTRKEEGKSVHTVSFFKKKKQSRETLLL